MFYLELIRERGTSSAVSVYSNFLLKYHRGLFCSPTSFYTTYYRTLGKKKKLEEDKESRQEVHEHNLLFTSIIKLSDKSQKRESILYSSPPWPFFLGVVA